MKAFTYFLCFWFTLVSCGCASHRSEMKVGMPSEETATTTCAPPHKLPALKYESVDGVKQLALLAVALPLAVVFVPLMLIAFWDYKP